MSDAYKIVLRGGRADGREMNVRDIKKLVNVQTVTLDGEEYSATGKYEDDREVFVPSV